MTKNVSIPSAVDWRVHNLVTPVQNQYDCIAGWAFATLASIESQVARLTNGRLALLSAQQLIDCGKPFGNHGCNGGWITNAFNFIIRNKGVNLASDYPFTESEQSCKRHRNANRIRLREYIKIPTGNELLLQLTLAKVGPVTAVIDSTQ
jgi:C1A family cysteine protease